MRVLVKITEDSKTRSRVYIKQTEEQRTKVLAVCIRDHIDKTRWLCGACSAFRYGTSLYAMIDPSCSAHAHVLEQEAKA